MSKTPKLNADEESILRECLRRQSEVDAAPQPPIWKYWEINDLEEQRMYGPKYRFGAWFGKAPDHVRKRKARAIQSLASASLLTIHRRTERRLSNIKLTDAGMRIAESLPDDSRTA